MEQNSILIRGSLKQLPQFSHENHGKRFYRMILEVARLSGAIDEIPVIVREDILYSVDPSAGAMLTVSGQIRSHNLRQDGIRHLLIFLFATDIAVEDGECINEVTITGTLCRAPTYRRTPLGREICDVMLAVPRAFHRADYIPCILWGRTAQEISLCEVKDRLRIYGRLQSRIYTKLTDEGSVEKTAYEVSALQAEILPPESTDIYNAGGIQSQ